MARALTPSLLSRILPGRRVSAAEPLSGGFRNSNFKLRLHGAAEPLVLRIYEHDPALCRKELDLFTMVAASVPVPEVVGAGPAGTEDCPPFLLLRYVDAVTLGELCRSGDTAAIAQAARSAGETLAAIGRHAFSKPGWLAPGPEVAAPLLPGRDPVPRFVDQCLASPLLQSRVPAELRQRASELIWSAAAEIAPLDCETRLVHGDFHRRNVLVRESAGRWRVAAVLDWEFAVSASPLMDIGNFLRYGAPLSEPHFSNGYVAGGGVLPHDWRRLSWLLDRAALCAILADPASPEPAVNETLAFLGGSFPEP